MAASSLAPQDPERAQLEVEAHAAAFIVVLLKNGFIEEAESFYEWYQEELGDSDRLLNLVESEEVL